MQFWRMLLLFFLIQIGVGFLFTFLQWPLQIGELVVSLIVSFIYAFQYHVYAQIPWYRNVHFHRTFAITFIILVLINLLFMNL